MPTATTANIEYSPSETLKPANSIVASDGIGMHALSATISSEDPGQAELVDHVDGELDERVGEEASTDRHERRDQASAD